MHSNSKGRKKYLLMAYCEETSFGILPPSGGKWRNTAQSGATWRQLIPRSNT